MELRHLRYFIALVEEGGFGKAAERLHMSQPPLSRQIALLEEELGTRLVERSRRGVRPTPAGDFFLERARRIVAEADSLARQTRLAGTPARGEVRVGCVGSIMYSFFPDFLSLLKERMPGIRFDIRELSSEEQSAELLAGRLDLGFLRAWGGAPGLRFLPLGEEYLSVMFPAAMATLVRGAGLAGLADEPFVSGSAPGMSERLREACARAGFIPRVAYECGQFSSLVKLVGAGLGWSIVPSLAFSGIRVEGVEFLALDESVPFGAAVGEAAPPPVVAEMLEAAQAFAAGLAAPPRL